MQPPSSAQQKLIDRLFFRPARNKDDVDAVVGGERRLRERRKDERRRDEAVLLDAQGSLRCGNPNRSLRVLVEWLESRADAAEDYVWLCSRIAGWGDPRLMNHLIQERIARLLVLKRHDEVLELMVQRLSVDRTLRPKTSAETLTVAQLAARSGHGRVAQALLSDFAARFKGDPRIPVAYALKQQIGAPAHVKEKTA